MDKIRIPRATARRLPLYYRCLILLNKEEKEKISSAELSEAVQVDSASIRRDFSYFGVLGKRSYGYDVKSLLGFFKKILDQDTLTDAALIEVGSLGHALPNYSFKRNSSIRVSCAFDIDSNLTGKIVSDVPVYDMKDMIEQIREQQTTIAVLTVPQINARKAANEIVKVGVREIVSFTPIRLSAPTGVRIQNVDLATELQTLVYFLESNKKIEDQSKALALLT